MSIHRFAVPETAKKRGRRPAHSADPVVLSSRNPHRLRKEFLAVDSLATNSLERNGADAEAQRAARDAIMAIPAFPELLTRLTRVFGPGAERDMIHQLIYWFSKPKMQHRWWAYKTADEWRDERGLNRKQVNKARARLKPFGVLEEKYGNYKRLHYRIDWVRLAELLSIPLKGGQSYEWEDFEDDDFLDEPLEPLKGGQSSWSNTPKGGSIVIDTPQMDDAPDIYAENSSNGGGQTNAREYTGEYLTGKTLLQRDGEPALAEPPSMNGKRKKEKEGQPPTTEHPSQNGHTQSESGLERERGEEVVAPAKPEDETLLAEVKEILDSNSGRWSYACYIRNDYAPEKVAGYIITNAEDIKRPEVVTSAARDELVQAVEYVQWEAVA
jgi:hypothetical protein